jgi:hypothetical protein
VNLTNVTGNRTLNYNGSSVKNLKAYVTSNLGVIYDCKATYNTYNNGSILSSKFYFAEHHCHSAAGEAAHENAQRHQLSVTVWRTHKHPSES